MRAILTRMETSSLPTALVGGAALLLSWLWLFRDLLVWVGATLGEEDYRLNLILAVSLGALVARRALSQPGAALDRLLEGPHLRWGPLGLAVASGVGWLATDYWLDVDILSATLFGLGTYGLLGLYLSPGTWRAGLPAALLLIGVLPFGAHLNIYLGFPLRLASAEGVREILSAAGVSVESAETLLVVENRAASVDLPCSGVRSLWSGGLFFLAATWLERRRLGVGWLVAGFAFCTALLGANFSRVLALVVLDAVLGLSEAAQIAHAPLGVIGFAGACALGWGMTRALPEPPSPSRALSQPLPWLAPGLSALFLALSTLHTPRPLPAQAEPAPFVLPLKMDTSALPLTRQEADLFVRHGSGQAGKWRFEWRGLRGSMLWVYSDSWRGHHPPELCLQGAGFEVSSSESWLIREGFPLRSLSLNGGAASAAYWFQSGERTTEDFSSRTWDGLGGEQGWVLVSVLWDGPQAPEEHELHSFYEEVHAAVAADLQRSP